LHALWRALNINNDIMKLSNRTKLPPLVDFKERLLQIEANLIIVLDILIICHIKKGVNREIDDMAMAAKSVVFCVVLDAVFMQHFFQISIIY
jgi:hypothetical protein